ncbi:hypothetical protein MSG28_015059 [Choristoneura fumiferana]|uniref:Uncharacterized protein n=1 Tax=Choristoneura fumiferana TaxID=7141 RepID=A0ACC0KYN7_CHOFU|nr:hypothetical protein MSG28_015059 [Choristoneura fumiferana]
MITSIEGVWRRRMGTAARRQASRHPTGCWTPLASSEAQAQAQAQAALFGFGSRYPAQPAALAGHGQPGSMPLHPAASRSSTSSSASTKEKSPSTSNSQPSMRASYGFPKTSSPSTMHSHSHSQAMSSLASLNSLASAPHQSKPSKHQPSQSRKDRELALLRGDLMLAQAAAHGAYHAANMSPLYPFGMPGAEKDRHGGIDSLTGLPHTILSDPSSVLGGVRLPPDTEIIKYTSSLAGPKDEYGNSRSSVEVIRLPTKPERAGHRTGSPAPNLADYAGISRELLQTIASQSGVSLAALERQLAGSAAAARRKPGAKPRRVVPELNSQGRPRNLGRGVSKPKKNTVASLLAQSRALGLRPALAQQLLGETDLFLEANPHPPLTADNFSFSARVVLGEYVQPAPDLPEPLLQIPIDDDDDIDISQARLVRELERTEKAELVKREKEARSQQLLEHINKNRTQLTIEPLPAIPKAGTEWKIPDLVMGPATKTQKERIMPPISLSLIPVSGTKDTQNEPLKLNLDQSGWKEQIEYNALDKMKDFAEKAAFDLPKTSKDKSFDFSLLKAQKAPNKENSLEKLIESYSRITEFINGCDWSKLQAKKPDDPKALEQKYLDAKNEFMSQNLMLMPKATPKTVLKEVIDLSADDELTAMLSQRVGKGALNVGKDGELSISVHPFGKDIPAKRRKHEEIEKQKIEEQAKKQQERELKRQQAMLLKEQERERRRQHTTFVRQLDARRRWEERERRKHQNLLDRLLAKEKKLQQRRKEMELLAELRHGRDPVVEHVPERAAAGLQRRR